MVVAASQTRSRLHAIKIACDSIVKTIAFVVSHRDEIALDACTYAQGIYVFPDFAYQFCNRRDHLLSYRAVFTRCGALVARQTHALFARDFLTRAVQCGCIP